MSFTKTFFIDDVEFEVEFSASRFVPAKTYGPAENCHPAEGGEVEIESIQVGGFEMLDFLNDATITILKSKAEESAPELFQDADDQAGEDEAEARAFDRDMDMCNQVQGVCASYWMAK